MKRPKEDIEIRKKSQIRLILMFYEIDYVFKEYQFITILWY